MRLVIVLFCLTIGTFSSGASAHESRPVYIEVKEFIDHRVSIKWKAPRSLAASSLPVPFISSCVASTTETMATMTDGYIGTYLVHCEEGITDRILNTGFRADNPSLSTIVSVSYVDGSETMKVLGPVDAEWKIPAQATFMSTVQSYLFLGVKHIASGWDHLLFISCLFLIATSWLRVLITITGFTIAHSVTLALSALDIVRLPVAPVEASIALSIVFLAWELARNRRQSVIWLYPLSVSASFGLLHGFGFASVLTATGMPENHILTALLFFNLGVELGQIVFLLILATLLYLFKKSLAAWGQPYNETALFRLSGYVAGITASYWFVERTVALI